MGLFGLHRTRLLGKAGGREGMRCCSPPELPSGRRSSELGVAWHSLFLPCNISWAQALCPSPGYALGPHRWASLEEEERWLICLLRVQTTEIYPLKFWRPEVKSPSFGQVIPHAEAWGQTLSQLLVAGGISGFVATSLQSLSPSPVAFCCVPGSNLSAFLS